MNGGQHFFVGASIGFISSIYLGVDIETGYKLLIAGGLSGIIADIDTRSVINRPFHKLAAFIKSTLVGVGTLGILIQILLYFIKGLIIPTLILGSIASFIIGNILREGLVRNILLTIVGLFIGYIGFNNSFIWTSLLGLYIGITPWTSHRGITHTLWAIILWGYIGYGAESYFQIQGLFITMVFAYISHLVCDTIVVFSKDRRQGIKWLYPIWNKEIKL